MLTIDVGDKIFGRTEGFVAVAPHTWHGVRVLCGNRCGIVLYGLGEVICGSWRVGGRGEIASTDIRGLV